MTARPDRPDPRDFPMTATRYLPDGAALACAGDFLDGPTDARGWEVWLGQDMWRNADDMMDRRAGLGDLVSLPNGTVIVVRPARPDTPRLPRTRRQKAREIIDRTHGAVTWNDLQPDEGSGET